MSYEKKCPYCHFGRVTVEGSYGYTCPDCHGTGYLQYGCCEECVHAYKDEENEEILHCEYEKEDVQIDPYSTCDGFEMSD